jgi:hypothetical protein
VKGVIVMKNRSNNGDAAGVAFATGVIEQNPYLQRTTNDDQASAHGESDVIDTMAEDEEGAAIELADESK